MLSVVQPRATLNFLLRLRCCRQKRFVLLLYEVHNRTSGSVVKRCPIAKHLRIKFRKAFKLCSFFVFVGAGNSHFIKRFRCDELMISRFRHFYAACAESIAVLECVFKPIRSTTAFKRNGGEVFAAFKAVRHLQNSIRYYRSGL